MTRRKKEIALAKVLGWTDDGDSVFYPDWDNSMPTWHDTCPMTELLKELAKQHDVSMGCDDGENWEVELIPKEHWNEEFATFKTALSPEEAVFEAAYEALVKHDKT